MGRVAVFIDAGYFWVQATHVILGARGPRTSLTIDYNALHQRVLDEVSTQFPGKDLLRVFWYDGPEASGSKGPDHIAIDLLDDFKLRLGTRNGVGQQKAVDGMIISDLLTFAQSRSIENALIITGDADLTPGVVSAQALGLRVHLVIIGPQASTSPYLAAEADRKVIWGQNVVASFATPSPVAPPTAAISPAASPPVSKPPVAAPPVAAPPVAMPPVTKTPITTPPVAAAPPPASSLSSNPPAPAAAQQLAPPTTSGATQAGQRQLPSPTKVGSAAVDARSPAATPARAVAPNLAGGTLPPTPASAPPILPTLTAADISKVAADAHAKLLTGPNAALLSTATAGIQPLPGIIDKALLRGATAYAGRMLSESEKRQLRIAFKTLL